MPLLEAPPECAPRLLRHMAAGHPCWRRETGAGACCGFRYTAEELGALERRGLIKAFSGAVGPWLLTVAGREFALDLTRDAPR